MKTLIIKGIEAAGLFFIIFFTPACELQSPFDYKLGVLQGTISIGPLCPVETVPPLIDCLPTAETYKAYQVSVWTTDLKTKVLDITPALNGAYSIRLPEGEFMVVLNKQISGAGGSNLPQQVVIAGGLTTMLNISIDTGIR